MIHRKLHGCLDKYNLHLWRLPDIPEARHPERYTYSSDIVLGIIPLFRQGLGAGDTGPLSHHLVRSACWARRSWLRFSDAMELGVQIAFYVGNTVTDVVFPILEASGVDVKRDVFLFDELALSGEPMTHLGKKMSFVGDAQFHKYRWVVQFDADMFLASPSGERGSFFSHFESCRRIPGALLLREGRNLDKSHYYWWKLLPDIASADDKKAEWLRRASSLSSPDVVSAYLDKGQSPPGCQGAIYAFPVGEYAKDSEWFAEAGRLLQDDEAAFSLWRAMGNEMFSISSSFSIPVCRSEWDLASVAEQGNPLYLSHVNGFHAEWQWREDIDAL